MTTTIDLDAGWQLRGVLGDAWRWYVGPNRRADESGWLEAQVPGSVLDDLARAGEVPDPYVGRNSLLSEWVPARAWVYRRVVAPGRLGDRRAHLVFEGVDHAATVLIDGEVLAHHEGSLSAFVIDATDALRAPGDHLLAVVVHPAPASEPQVGDTARVRVHKARMGYGWDFCPRMINLGIWRPVRLVLGEAPWRPAPRVELGASLRHGAVEVAGAEHLELSFGTRRLAVTNGELAELDDPPLWWPNRSGEAALVRLSARRGDQEVHFAVGFRHLELAPNPGASADARPYTVVINGTPLFVFGWNWVPIDALYGVPRPDKLSRLLDLAADAGVNLLRVWGGGLIETPEFYAGCDARGLLVWQEFSLSSSGMGSVPSDDWDYLAQVRADAEAAIPARRHHPSLALWCGGNELARSLPGRDDEPLDETTPVLAMLKHLVAELDPGRPFLPTSPSGPHFLNRPDIIAADPDGQHDVHGPWEHQGLAEHQRFYDAATCLLHSEVGVEGMTNRAAHDALIPPELSWPADRSNPVYEHLGAWWNNAPLVQASFGGRLGDLEHLRRASQHLHHDGLRYAIEATRRRAPRASGIIPWQLNESYPNAWCTSAVDYFGVPKPAYFGVRRAYRDDHVCAAFDSPVCSATRPIEAEIFAFGQAGEVVARFVEIDGEELAIAHFGHVPLNKAHPARLGRLECTHLPKGRVILLDLALWRDGALAAANRYVMTLGEDLAPLLELDESAIGASWDGDHLELAHLAGPAALGLIIEDLAPAHALGWLSVSDNVFDLLPGEAVRVATACVPDAAPVRDLLSVSGWNVARLWVPRVARASA